jgi:hypothetical protein
LRKEHGENFTKGYQSDTHLGTAPDETGQQLAPIRPTSDRLAAEKSTNKNPTNPALAQ